MSRHPVLDAPGAAEARLRMNREVYAELDRWLGASPFGDEAKFLNWGYEPVGAGNADCATFPEGPNVPASRQRRLVAELIGAESLRGKDVLDVGCGRGGTLSVLAQHAEARSLSGIDLSPEHIAFCRRHLPPSARLRVGDGSELPQPDHSIDALVTLECSGAFPDLARFVAHAHRVLRPGGQLFWGDVFVSGLLPDLRTALEQQGFCLESERDVTLNVLRARVAASSLDRLPPPAGLLKTFWERFSVRPGSPIFRRLSEGTLTYRLWRWRKVGPLPSSGAEAQFAACARLAEREALFARLLDEGEEGEDAPLAPARDVSLRRLLPFGIPDASARVLVFAFAHAGGGASVFRSYCEAPSAELELVPVQLPGRENRLSEAPYTTMGQLANDVADALYPLLASGRRFALLGHSLGAKIAFEVALALEARERHCAAVLVCGCPSPDLPIAISERDLEPDRFPHTLDMLGGTRPEVIASAELMELLMPMLRADFRVAAGYRGPSGRLQAPLIAVAASGDQLVTPDQVRGWRGFTAGEFSYHELEGGHFFMREARQQIVAIARRALRGTS